MLEQLSKIEQVKHLIGAYGQNAVGEGMPFIALELLEWSKEISTSREDKKWDKKNSEYLKALKDRLYTPQVQKGFVPYEMKIKNYDFVGVAYTDSINPPQFAGIYKDLWTAIVNRDIDTFLTFGVGENYDKLISHSIFERENWTGEREPIKLR